LFYDSYNSIREWIIVAVSTDDFRYFGTDKAVAKFETDLDKEMKLDTLSDDATNDYLSVEIKQDLKNGTCELTQTKYWEAAIERFKDYFPNGPKPRATPLPEGLKLEEPTDAEIEEAATLPFRELMGVLNFPTAFTKIELKYAISTLSQHLKGWGSIHFEMALRSLEYGYTTRTRGLIYSRGRDKFGINVTYGYSDSNFEPPLSRGCRATMLNGAAVSCTSALHHKTNTSTCEAEAEEVFHCSSDVVAIRRLLEELGLKQLAPTTIFCDNTPAVTLLENTGAHSKKSRSMDIQIFAVRDRLLDQECKLEYLPTNSMPADIGTKALGRAKFELFRDILTGYHLVPK
jgi:hypothetical protein